MAGAGKGTSLFRRKPPKSLGFWTLPPKGSRFLVSDEMVEYVTKAAAAAGVGGGRRGVEGGWGEEEAGNVRG